MRPLDKDRAWLFLFHDASRRFGRRAASGRFRLAVDRSFTLPGAGTVLSGQAAVGDRVVVSPSGFAARINPPYGKQTTCSGSRPRVPAATCGDAATPSLTRILCCGPPFS